MEIWQKPYACITRDGNYFYSYIIFTKIYSINFENIVFYCELAVIFLNF